MVKSFAIATGLYRPARWLSRQIRPSQHRVFHEDIRLYRSLIAPDALCFDVGANVGEKSEALLEAGARVVAFEPNPLVLPELKARCAHKNWTVLPTAVGSAAGVATLYVREAHVNSSLLASAAPEAVATYQVPVLTLDAAIQRFGRPAFCKIDVEGWELEVLRGLTQSIPLISFEFQLGDRGIQSTLACLRRLEEFGAARVNLTPADNPTFHFTEWMPLPQLRAWFPGDLKATLRGDHYGDVYVMRDTQASKQ